MERAQGNSTRCFAEWRHDERRVCNRCNHFGSRGATSQEIIPREKVSTRENGPSRFGSRLRSITGYLNLTRILDATEESN